MENWSAEQRAQVEANLRGMSWKAITRDLMTCFEKRQLEELPPATRKWLEINRYPRTEEEAAKQDVDCRHLQDLLADLSCDKDWLKNRSETAPISGWVVNASLFLKDGERWWLFAARRHDDRAPLVGATVPSPANKLDLKKLGKIIAYAGGNPKRELLRTGAITQEEHDQFIAEGRPHIAEYGQIFFWWKD